MHISYCSASGSDSQAWITGLQAAFPEARVNGWLPGDPPADYAVVWSPPQLFFDQQTALKGIFNTGAGVDALLALNLPPDVPIVRLDDAGMAVQMAEFVTHAVIRYFRQLDTYQTQAKAGVWQELAPRQRSDYPVGVMGMGVLGQRVCAALRAFDFVVQGWSRSAQSHAAMEALGVRSYFGAAQLPAFLAASRLLVCLLPLTPETQGLLRRDTLLQLQPGSYLIHVARGPIVVEADLLALLDSGHITGATLDVFCQEDEVKKQPGNHPLWSHPFVTATPHISAQTLVHTSIAQIAAKIRALQNGAAAPELAGYVQREQGY